MARISPAWLAFRPSSLSSSPRPQSQSSFHSSVRHHEWLKTRLDNRALLSLTGEDSQTFLQGLITTNATRIASSPAATYTAFLTPPGRLLFDVFIYPASEPETGFLIDHHLGPEDELYKWLRRFVLRSRVKIVKDERELWALWPNGDADAQTESQSLHSLSESALHVWKDGRGDGKLGYRVLGNSTAGLGLQNSDGLRSAPLSAYALHVLLHGSLPPSLSPPYPVTFPFEANLDYHNAVDFRKGCYVGQELTARTYHTGVIRKRLVPVAISKADTPASRDLMESIPIQNTRFENEVTELLQNAELKLDGPTLDTMKKTKALGKLCGPMLSMGEEMFGLALLRVDHDSFSQADWPVLRLVGHEEWSARPLKPHWWPQDT